MTYVMKPLSCDPQRIRGMSERMIVSHYENNYGGAVKRLNLVIELCKLLVYEIEPLHRAPIVVLVLADDHSLRHAADALRVAGQRLHDIGHGSPPSKVSDGML